VDYYDNGFVKPPMTPLGTLLLVGGAEDTSAQGIIPKKMLSLAGKSSEEIRVLILTSASTKPLDNAYINKWQLAFAQHGANPSHITVLHPESRDEYDALADAIFLQGTISFILPVVAKKRYWNAWEIHVFTSSFMITTPRVASWADHQQDAQR
jgi:hypothetical protein